MYKYLFALLAFTCWSCSMEQAPAQQETPPPATGYNEELAKSVGADDYGMKRYVMALLKDGPNRTHDSTETARIQRAHLDNINRLAEEGVLVLAGPFMQGGAYRGIFIFDVETKEEAQALVATDPAVQAGRLSMELLPWYGSAALMQVNALHLQVAKDMP